MYAETGIITLSDVLMIRWEGNSYTGEGEDYSKLVWHDGNKDPKPTEEEVNAAIVSLQTEYDGLEYARLAGLIPTDVTPRDNVTIDPPRPISREDSWVNTKHNINRIILQNETNLIL